MLKKDYPELAKYWNYKRNNKDGIYFEDFFPHSNKKVWWKCDKCGKKWQTKVCLRKKPYCPICNRKGPQGEKNITKQFYNPLS